MHTSNIEPTPFCNIGLTKADKNIYLALPNLTIL